MFCAVMLYNMHSISAVTNIIVVAMWHVEINYWHQLQGIARPYGCMTALLKLLKFYTV